ncbi:hypothetical protein GCM10007190_07370 [Macrococcus hajekii]|nr:hypothetical protein [Macrococcus hajekii]GGB01898.1 hypothetical protein GCM10007190_07370 [Macrococcus hajekii]
MDKFKKMLFDYFVVLEEEYEPPSINAILLFLMVHTLVSAWVFYLGNL